MELAVLPWLSAVYLDLNNGDALLKASQLQLFDVMLRKRFASDANAVSDYLCPSCRNPLIPETYENKNIYQCRFCGGSLVDDVKLPRIIVRKDVKYSERINALSRITSAENQLRQLARNKNNSANANMNLLYCPKCKKQDETRTFYSMAYLVELEPLELLRESWFEKDELEILQCMIDNRMASTPLPLPDASEKSNVLDEVPLE